MIPFSSGDNFLQPSSTIGSGGFRIVSYFRNLSDSSKIFPGSEFKKPVPSYRNPSERDFAASAKAEAPANEKPEALAGFRSFGSNPSLGYLPELQQFTEASVLTRAFLPKL